MVFLKPKCFQHSSSAIQECINVFTSMISAEACPMSSLCSNYLLMYHIFRGTVRLHMTIQGYDKFQAWCTWPRPFRVN